MCQVQPGLPIAVKKGSYTVECGNEVGENPIVALDKKLVVVTRSPSIAILLNVLSGVRTEIDLDSFELQPVRMSLSHQVLLPDKRASRARKRSRECNRSQGCGSSSSVRPEKRSTSAFLGHFSTTTSPIVQWRRQHLWSSEHHTERVSFSPRPCTVWKGH